MDTQLKQILSVTATALKQISDGAKEDQSKAFAISEDRRKNKVEIDRLHSSIEEFGVKDGRLDCVAGNGAMSELGHGIEKEEPVELYEAVSSEQMLSNLLIFVVV